MKDDVIICRCEDISYGEIVEAIDSGLTTLDELKRVLRTGMGPCQGRTCSRLIARIITERVGGSVADMKSLLDRPPAMPVEIGILAGEVLASEGDED